MLKKKFDYADYSGARIEEYDTDDIQFVLEQDRRFYYLSIGKDGCCTHVIDKKAEKISRTGRYHVDDELEEYIHYDENSGRCYACVLAEDAESAIKIAAERRAKYLSKRFGL